MLTFEDCLALCELTEAEIDAIAEHEQVTETVAVAIGHYLIQQPHGQVLIRRMIVDDIAAAQERGDLVRAARLKQTLRRFIEGASNLEAGAGAGQSGVRTKSPAE
jgi:hypothetical protein